ncbi:lactosylceramide 4-alpha-galactosyltransferase [Hyalella azteca]|uniref:Lactosylceramide 4-alpha-galactosyltransferase n=1 Tax=Hyalella azteca TaxID=294128 RepID=A0A8B7NI65_HYAAZ|nr:lactosylceramide 4-alpha-galactosyltransferase [Hyalella azteca]
MSFLLPTTMPRLRYWRRRTKLAVALVAALLLVVAISDHTGFTGALFSRLTSPVVTDGGVNEDFYRTGLSPKKFCRLELTDGSTVELPELYKDVTPDVAAYNVYLMETSSATVVTPRALCGLESYCNHNPGAHVWFLVTSQYLESTTLAELMSLQATYPNLCVAHLNFSSLFQDTPLLELYLSQRFNRTSFLANNLCNMGRLAIVYKFGGLYTDMDVIALRPLMPAANFIALQDDKSGYLNAAIHYLRRQHPMSMKIMEHIAANYKGNVWGANGPTAQTNAAKHLGCDRSPVGVDRLVNNTNNRKPLPVQPCDDLQQKQPCSNHTEECDWVALKSSAFMAVPYTEAKKLFLGPKKDEKFQPIETLYPVSLGVHFFNYVTRFMKVQPGSHMHRLALKSCPVIVKEHPLL